jgi:hypothetical protein
MDKIAPIHNKLSMCCLLQLRIQPIIKQGFLVFKYANHLIPLAIAKGGAQRQTRFLP